MQREERVDDLAFDAAGCKPAIDQHNRSAGEFTRRKDGMKKMERRCFPFVGAAMTCGELRAQTP